MSEGKEAAFKLSDYCVLKIVKGDITTWFIDGSTDAIVNPANERMLGGGGADGAESLKFFPESVVLPGKQELRRVVSFSPPLYLFDEVVSIAISTVKQFGKDFKEVHFVMFSDDTYTMWLNKANDLHLLPPPQGRNFFTSPRTTKTRFFSNLRCCF